MIYSSKDKGNTTLGKMKKKHVQKITSIESRSLFQSIPERRDVPTGRGSFDSEGRGESKNGPAIYPSGCAFYSDEIPTLSGLRKTAGYTLP